MRLDILLTQKQIAPSRTRAGKLIEAGQVLVNGIVRTKASFDVLDTDKVVIQGDTQRYVSRGGEKLEAALTAFSVSVEGAVALDIGASTGGFTDCLLQHGAAKVYAVDCGQGQLDARLRADARVISMEKCNARYLTVSQLGGRCELATMDVSFISQTLLYPMLREVLAPGAMLLSLIKPQFEAGRSALNRHGVVSDPKRRQAAVDAVCEQAKGYGLRLLGLIESPIIGGSGNVEYLACFTLEEKI